MNSNWVGTAASLPVCVVCDQLRGSVSSLLQTVARDEDMSWARREQQALGRVPSRGERMTVLECDCSLITSEAKQNQLYFPQQHSIKIETCALCCLLSPLQHRLRSQAALAPAPWGNLWVWVEGEPWEPWCLTPPHPTPNFCLSTGERPSPYWSRSHATAGCMDALTAACGG